MKAPFLAQGDVAAASGGEPVLWRWERQCRALLQAWWKLTTRPGFLKSAASRRGFRRTLLPMLQIVRVGLDLLGGADMTIVVQDGLTLAAMLLMAHLPTKRVWTDLVVLMVFMLIMVVPIILMGFAGQGSQANLALAAADLLGCHFMTLGLLALAGLHTAALGMLQLTFVCSAVLLRPPGAPALVLNSLCFVAFSWVVELHTAALWSKMPAMALPTCTADVRDAPVRQTCEAAMQTVATQTDTVASGHPTWAQRLAGEDARPSAGLRSAETEECYAQTEMAWDGDTFRCMRCVRPPRPRAARPPLGRARPEERGGEGGDSSASRRGPKADTASPEPEPLLPDFAPTSAACCWLSLVNSFRHMNVAYTPEAECCALHVWLYWAKGIVKYVQKHQECWHTTPYVGWQCRVCTAMNHEGSAWCGVCWKACTPEDREPPGGAAAAGGAPAGPAEGRGADDESQAAPAVGYSSDSSGGLSEHETESSATEAPRRPDLPDLPSLPRETTVSL